MIYRDKIFIKKGDITLEFCEAIVNAANSSLSGGGGVDGAIHKACGHRLSEKCGEIISKIGFLPPGEAVLTPAYDMKNVKYIIHTVGPIWRGGKNGEAQKLYNCYFNSLKLAFENKIKTIAFPAISTGVYGYPFKEAFSISIKAISDFLNKYGALNFDSQLLGQISLIYYEDYMYREALKELEAV
jgi:O-acetyl-ADP-ribose deacetylase (regulator of RNase III)